MLGHFVFLFWRLRWCSKGVLSFMSQMSLRRKRADSGMRTRAKYWKEILRTTMTVNDLFFYFLSHQVLVLFYGTLFFYFEGYKSTPVWENKPRPHSTISTFNTPSWPLLLSTFCGCAWNFVFFSLGIACLWNIWQSSRTNESIITHRYILWWREVTSVSQSYHSSIDGNLW